MATAELRSTTAEPKDTELKELLSELTTSTRVRSSEPVFQEKAQRIKDLLREELRSKTQGVQVVETPSSKGVEIGLKGTTHVAEVPVREEFQIKEVHRSAENLMSSASGSRAAGAQLRLYINCEIVLGPGSRAGSSEKDVLLQESQGDAQGPLEESVPTGVMEAHGIKDLPREEQKTITEGVQKGIERVSLNEGLEGTAHITESALKHARQGNEEHLGRLSSKYVQGGLKGKTDVTETAVPEESQDIMLEEKLQGSFIRLRIDPESISKPGQQGKSSQVSLGEAKGATIGRDFPTPQEVFNLAAQKYLHKMDPSKLEDLNAFVNYLEAARKVLIVDTKKGSVIITIECGTLEILEVLWEDYNTGHMTEVAQTLLVTDDILEEFGEVKLTITIPEEEYKACREFLLQVPDSIPNYILARGDRALAAYHRALDAGTTKDTRVKVSLIGQDRVGKTSLGKSLRGEPFDKDECSTDGVKMFDPIKNAGVEAWKNPASLESTTAFEHKSAEYVTKELLDSATEQQSAGESSEEPVRDERTGDETRTKKRGAYTSSSQES